jgi:hypothetical protein
MAVDTYAKRVSASTLFPHVKAIVPSGTVDRVSAAWVYSGNPVEQSKDFVYTSEGITIRIFGRNYTALSLEKLLQFIPFPSDEPIFTLHRKKPK